LLRERMRVVLLACALSVCCAGVRIRFDFSSFFMVVALTAR
jgi:hypothetical protein